MPGILQSKPTYIVDRQDAGWLQELLARAVSENWCLESYCTTCGSFQLRISLGWAETGPDRFRPRRVTEEEVGSVLQGLRHCRPVPETQEFEQAVRWVLLRIWDQFGDDAHQRLFPRLNGTWAEEVLNSMRRHYQAKMERRRQHEARQGVKKRDVEMRIAENARNCQNID